MARALPPMSKRFRRRNGTPAPPGTVVVPDTLAPRKNAEAAKPMGTAGCRFPILPPKSPDPTPMEMAFSKPEAHLRRIGARSFTDMVDALAEIRDLYSPQECWNHFKATGMSQVKSPVL